MDEQYAATRRNSEKFHRGKNFNDSHFTHLHRNVRDEHNGGSLVASYVKHGVEEKRDAVLQDFQTANVFPNLSRSDYAFQKNPPKLFIDLVSEIPDVVLDLSRSMSKSNVSPMTSMSENLKQNLLSSTYLPRTSFSPQQNQGLGSSSPLTYKDDICGYRQSFSSTACLKPFVQTNVNENFENLMENRVHSSTPRRSVRSKNSESQNKMTAVESYSLSKSWGSSYHKTHFKPSNKQKCLYQTDKVKELFQKEYEKKIRRAEDFYRIKLQRNIFIAWGKQRSFLRHEANKLRRKHLLVKAMKGLNFAMKRRKAIHEYLIYERNAALMKKCWQTWRRKTCAKKREKILDMFNQWRYYIFNMKRVSLLHDIARRHFLSRNLYKWKKMFDLRQKTRLANVHFKVNIIYKFWNCWVIYIKERCVKNLLRKRARFFYGKKCLHRVFNYWKKRSEKSSLCRRLSRRRRLIKVFFHWKHWTQYAKLVHLRLLNKCKEYHRKMLLRRLFKLWRQSTNIKQAKHFCRRKQQSRVMKLWHLRYQRKHLHKHLCKAIARKVRKRRYFIKWLHVVIELKQVRKRYISRLQIFFIRAFFQCWKEEARKTKKIKIFVHQFRVAKSERLVREHWLKWKFQQTVFMMTRRSELKRKERCIKKYYDIWKLVTKKCKLARKLEESSPYFCILLKKRYLKMWKLKQQEADDLRQRSANASRTLQRKTLCRIFRSWRVVNQEDCIIEPLLKRRVRRNMARVFDSWKNYSSLRYKLERFNSKKSFRLKKNVFENWSLSLWYLTKQKETEETLRRSKIARHFLKWQGYMMIVRESKRLVLQGKNNLLRKHMRIWKEKAQCKVEYKETMFVNKFISHFILKSFFTSWKYRHFEHAQMMTSFVEVADKNQTTLLMRRSFLIWRRQYFSECQAKDHSKKKCLTRIFLTWKEFAKSEFDRQVCDFTFNLAMKTSSGSTFLSTSGYQTSFKNSDSSFLFFTSDKNGQTLLLPKSTSRSRPFSPTGDQVYKGFSMLPIYHPVSRCVYPTVKLFNYEQECPRSSEEETIPFSDVLSFDVDSSEAHISFPQYEGEENDLDSAASLRITESIHSYQPPSDAQSLHSYQPPSDAQSLHSYQPPSDAQSLHSYQPPSDAQSLHSYQPPIAEAANKRELLLAYTIIHWRSLSLSVAFRSWFKCTQHIHHLQWIYGEWIIRKKNKLFGKYFHLWRRWLFVSVLCRQYWVCMMKKKYLRKLQQYNKQQNLCSQRNNDAYDFMKRTLITKFYKIWKKKGTTKTRLLSIISGWQRLVKVREMDKLVIERSKKIDRQNRLQKTFYRWKNFTRHLQMATRFYSNILLKRCFLSWKTVALHRALHRKNMSTFRAKQVQLKVFHEWKRRFEHMRTARIVFQVSKKRKIKEMFNAWQLWAKESRFLRKSLHDYNYVLEKRKLKEKLLLWFAVAKEYGRLREYYHRSLQIRILRGWKYVLIQKIETQKATAVFKLFTARIMLRSTLEFWRTTTRNQQTLVEFTAARERRHLEFFFNHWHREKMNKDGEKYCARCVLKKAFHFWCKKLSKWQKTRKHFQLWKTKVAANNEQYEIAQNFCLNSRNQLMKKKFLLWRHQYENSKTAKYFKEKRSMQCSFLAWYAYFCKKKSLSNCFREFQRSHKRTNFGLIMKCFKIWQAKWILSRKADNQLQQILRSKYWKLWRHNFVQKRVSSAMVYLDNQTVLSKAFTSWYACTSASKALSKEIIIRRSRRWLQTWMKRHKTS